MFLFCQLKKREAEKWHVMRFGLKWEMNENSEKEQTLEVAAARGGSMEMWSLS